MKRILFRFFPMSPPSSKRPFFITMASCAAASLIMLLMTSGVGAPYAVRPNRGVPQAHAADIPSPPTLVPKPKKNSSLLGYLGLRRKGSMGKEGEEESELRKRLKRGVCPPDASAYQEMGLPASLPPLPESRNDTDAWIAMAEELHNLLALALDILGKQHNQIEVLSTTVSVGVLDWMENAHMDEHLGAVGDHAFKLQQMFYRFQGEQQRLFALGSQHSAIRDLTVELLSGQIVAMEGKLKAVEEKLKTSTRSNRAVLEMQKQENEGQLAQLKAERNKTQAEIEELKTQNRELQESADARIRGLELQIVGLEEHKQGSEDQLVELRNLLAELKAQANSEKEATRAQVETITAEHQQEVGERDSQIVTLHEKIKKLEDQKQGDDLRLTELHEELEVLKSEKQEISTLVAQHKETAGAVAQQIDTLQQKINKLEQQKTDHEQQVAVLKGQIQSMKDGVEELSSRHQRVTQKKEERIKELEQKVSALEAQNDKDGTTLVGLYNEMDRLKAENHSIQESKNTEIKALESRHSEVTSEKNAQIEELHKRIDQLEKQKSKHEQQLADQRGELKKVNSSKRKLKDELTANREVTDSKDGQLREQQRRIDQLERKTQEDETQLVALRAQLAKLEATVAENGEQQKMSEEQKVLVESLQTRISQFEGQKANYEWELEKVNAELRDLKTQLGKAKESTQEKLTDFTHEHLRALAERNAEIDALHDRIDNLKKEKTVTVYTSNPDDQETLDSLSRQVKALEAELESWRTAASNERELQKKYQYVLQNLDVNASPQSNPYHASSSLPGAAQLVLSVHTLPRTIARLAMGGIVGSDVGGGQTPLLARDVPTTPDENDDDVALAQQLQLQLTQVKRELERKNARLGEVQRELHKQQSKAEERVDRHTQELADLNAQLEEVRESLRMLRERDAQELKASGKEMLDGVEELDEVLGAMDEAPVGYAESTSSRSSSDGGGGNVVDQRMHDVHLKGINRTDSGYDSAWMADSGVGLDFSRRMSGSAAVKTAGPISEVDSENFVSAASCMKANEVSAMIRDKLVRMVAGRNAARDRSLIKAQFDILSMTAELRALQSKKPRTSWLQWAKDMVVSAAFTIAPMCSDYWSTLLPALLAGPTATPAPGVTVSGPAAPTPGPTPVV